MSKYEKAVSFINDVLCGLIRAELAGFSNDMVYIYTDVNDMHFQIHDSEVEYLAQKYDLHHNRRA